MPDIPDIQKLLDQLLLKYPQAREYIEWAKYVPRDQEDGPYPSGTTDIISVQKVTEETGLWVPGPKIVVALRVDGPYDTFLHLLEEVL